MPTAAPLPISRTREQPRCPSTEEWTKDVAQAYSGIVLSQKRNKTGPFIERWMDPEMVIQSEVSQKEKKQISYINTYMWNLEKRYG